MSAGQIAAPYGRVRGPLVITLVVGAFAIGVVTGFGVPRTVGTGSVAAAAQGPAAQARTFAGVAENNMSAAARAAFVAMQAAAAKRASAGVADNNMSDAARRAILDQWTPPAQASGSAIRRPHNHHPAEALVSVFTPEQAAKDCQIHRHLSC